MDAHEKDVDLLARFVATFGILDDLTGFQVPSILLAHTNEAGWQYWQPRQITTLPSALESLYFGLGLPGRGSTRFPLLYETLVLSYRWAEVELGAYRLLANEPAEDLSPLLSEIRADVHLCNTLVPNGYFQFGRGFDVDYDPVCFDFRQRQKNGDCRIVKLDHEAILCHGRIRVMTELAPNFRSLVVNTIHHAASKQAHQAGGGNMVSSL
jgi:hypothetical protein